MLRCDIITIFPEFFREAFAYGIIRKARAAGLVETKAHDLRRWTSDKHHVVDDRPFGGGEGMVLKPEPIFAAVNDLSGFGKREDYPPQTRVILLSPQGRTFTQALAQDLSQSAAHIVLICGRYEGVDERVSEALATDEISIGVYFFSSKGAEDGKTHPTESPPAFKAKVALAAVRGDRTLAPRGSCKEDAAKSPGPFEIVFLEFR